MARVKHLDQITGNIGKLSFYTRKGSDEIFVRTKGGASKEQIKRRPEFENVRRNNKEFGGCSQMSKAIRQAFGGLQHVADFNLAPALCSFMKNIQKADTNNTLGERSILLSQHKQYLIGYNFNRKNSFDSVLHIPLQWKINRENTCANISIPTFACSMGLSMPPKYGLFRISASFAAVTDRVLGERKHSYEPIHDTLGHDAVTSSTTWFTRTTTVSTQELNLQLDMDHPNIVYNQHDTLLLTVAIEFGELDAFGNPTPARGAGAGKILGVG